MSDESALITRAQETLSEFILSIGFLMMHEIGVISFDRLFSVIFFRLLSFSEPNGIVMLCVENETPPGSIENHIEPLTSKPAAALLKLVYFG